MSRWNPDPKFLADLGPGHRLIAFCPSCERRKTLDVNALEKTLGPYYEIEAVRKRVRCSGCGARTKQLHLVIERR